MNRQPYQTPPKWWEPRLTPWWVRLSRPLRRRVLRRKQRILRVEVEGLPVLRQALADRAGVLITPNHSAHYDSNALYEAADQLGRPFYFLTAWQVFAVSGWFDRMSLQRHGCFSIDREGTDLRAFKRAVSILQEDRHPLVVFPEGDIYHLSDRVRPFRDGAAAIALAAAKKASRPIVAVPCGIQFRYLEDPRPALLDLMDRLERRFYWRPRRHEPLPARIYHLAQAMLALKEIEYLGKPQLGPLPQRIEKLMRWLLDRIATRRQVVLSPDGIPEQVKQLRRAAISQAEADGASEASQLLAQEDLEDLFFVTQLYSYPGDYVAEKPSLERLAETLDKFEEDVLDVEYPSVRAARRVLIRFGEPIAVRREAGQRDQSARLTDELEQRVQRLLDEMSVSSPPMVG